MKTTGSPHEDHVGEASSFCIELPIRPDWASIEGLHRAVMRCIEVPLADPELCRVVGMVASELSENAVKHGDWSRPEGASLVVWRRGAAGDAIAIEVSSPAAGRADLEVVAQRITWIRGFPSARDAFAARVRGLSRAAAGRCGGLGLVRIAYEGGCELEAWLSPDERLLHVKATLDGGRLPDG